MRLLCVAREIVQEGVRTPVPSPCGIPLLRCLIDSAMLDSGVPFWATCCHEYPGKTRFRAQQSVGPMLRSAVDAGLLDPTALGCDPPEKCAGFQLHTSALVVCKDCKRQSLATEVTCAW